MKKNNFCLANDIVFSSNIDGSKLSTLGVGGIIDTVIYPDTLEKIIQICAYLDRYHIIGRGSNTLIADNVIFTPVISLSRYNQLDINDGIVRVGAGYSLIKMVRLLGELGYTGLEALGDVPASIGGATYMNCSAFGTQISDYISEVKILSGDNVITYSYEECEFGYRHSVFTKSNLIILEVVFRLRKGSSVDIRMLRDYYHNLRKTTQPSERSLGSVFKRIATGISPAQLIDQAGLKGYHIGGAMVSTKHSGFIINTGGATAKDYLDLIYYITRQIQSSYDILLEQEIIYLRD